MAHDSAAVAVVTGASRGIGRCAALALADAGYDLVVTARRVEGPPPGADEAALGLSTLDSTVAAARAAGRRVLPVAMDLLDPASVDGLADAALAFAGRVDVLVNNAIYQGRGPMERILDLELADAETVMRADYLHQLRLIQRLLPALRAARGTVVNMSSGSAHLDPPAPAGMGGWGVAYAAAKAAFTRIVPVLHAEFAAEGLRAYNVDPGFIANERMVATGGDTQFTAAGFRGAPPEVPGAVIAWLCTDPAAAGVAGTMVFAQRVCKDLGLVPGWPPPRRERPPG